MTSLLNEWLESWTTQITRTNWVTWARWINWLTAPSHSPISLPSPQPSSNNLYKPFIASSSSPLNDAEGSGYFFVIAKTKAIIKDWDAAYLDVRRARKIVYDDYLRMVKGRVVLLDAWNIVANDFDHVMCFRDSVFGKASTCTVLMKLPQPREDSQPKTEHGQGHMHLSLSALIL